MSFKKDYCKVCGRQSRPMELMAGAGGFAWTCPECKAAKKAHTGGASVPSSLAGGGAGIGGIGVGGLVVGCCVIGLAVYSLAWVWSKVAYWDNIFVAAGTTTYSDATFQKPDQQVKFDGNEFTKYEALVYSVADCSARKIEIILPVQKLHASARKHQRADGKEEIVAYELPMVSHGGGFLRPETVFLAGTPGFDFLVQQAKATYYYAHPGEFNGMSWIKPSQCPDKPGADVEPPVTSEVPAIRGVERSVVASSGLYMRVQPAQTAAPIVLIPGGGRVNVIEETPTAEIIGGVAGKWVKVAFGGHEGYVFDGFLSR